MLLSDLYMPGISRSELLPIVRRQFPAIHMIVKSSAFSTTAVLTTVETDAFYEKASNVGVLLQLLNTPAKTNRSALRQVLSFRPTTLEEITPPLCWRNLKVLNRTVERERGQSESTPDS